MNKLFDLNIEQVLEHWEPEHAVREVIANALDEQVLTKTQSIEIYKKDGKWHIRDYGRGLKYSHFTQNENQEKLQSPYLIGKFGVGLKDALAVFYRKGIDVEINSRYAHITLTMAAKTGFDIQTLHALFDDPLDVAFIGTEFILSGISDADIDKAKSLFLCFNTDLKLLEKTRYGDVYHCPTSPSIIYVNGVQVNTEENFLFCYNITNVNAQIRKALNRERSNVGRTAYSSTVNKILTQCKSSAVLLPLVEDFQNVTSGRNKDESGWVDVATYAARTLNETDTSVFMTPQQRHSLTNQQVEILEQSGKKLVMVTENVYGKIEGNVTTFDTVYETYADSHVYQFIPVDSLTRVEQETLALSQEIVKFLEKYDYKSNIQIKVSETIRISSDGTTTFGIYVPSERAIIVRRDVLSNREKFCSVLLHEFAHFQHNFDDNTRAFENDLTAMLGSAFIEILSEASKTDPPETPSSKSGFLSHLLGK